MRIVYSCVVDRNPKFFRQGMLLVRSLCAVGVRAADIVVNLTPGARSYRPEFEAQGCVVRDTILFADGKYCNKVAQLRNAPEDADFIVCCDTDLLFLRNIAPDLVGKKGLVLGKVVDFDNPPIERLRAAQELIGGLPDIDEVPADLNGKPTLAGNFNGGLYILPGTHLRALSSAWEAEALALHGNPAVIEALGEFAWHIDQIAFCFALNRLGLRHQALPITFNYPLHFSVDHHVDEPGDLRILHYHDAVDEFGLPHAGKVSDPAIAASVHNSVARLMTLIRRERQRRLASVRAGQRFTFLIGFHRSGTSLMASGCDALGYSIGSGELMEASFDNPKGYYENRRLVKINERIQEELNSDWDDIFFSFGGRRQVLAEAFSPVIREFLSQEFLAAPHPNYILKDPRMMQTHGIWRAAVRAMGIATPDIVFISRNPLECAQSQQSRYRKTFEKDGAPFHVFGKDLRETLLLWYAYTVRFLLTLEEERIILVRYPDLIAKPRETLRRVADWAGLRADSDGIARFCDDFLETGLRHHARDRADLRKAVLEFPFIADLFEKLEDLAARPHVTAVEMRAIGEAHREAFADLLRFDFLGRLFTVPKRKWIQERHMRARRR